MDLEASMLKSVEATQRTFNTIRTGRANATLLDKISVEYYGAETPIKSLATLTEDRRKDLCKLVAKYAEEGKVALRNIRRDGIDRIKKQEKDGELSEDQSRDEQDKVQKLTDRFIAELEKQLAAKEADILKV